MAETVNIVGEEFRRLQLTQLDMVVELDRVCRAHDINYVLLGGSMIGAVRHKGYIPWDDDADIAMTREDYEKFKLYANELDQSICFFQDHSTEPEYRWGYGKLRRTGTTFVRTGQEHLKFKTGVFIDIFPFDDVPISLIGQLIQSAYCFILRKITWSEVGRVQCKGFLKLWYTLLSKIPLDWVFKRVERYTKKSSNSTPNNVRILLYVPLGKLYRKAPLKIRYGFPKRWILERAEYEFEGHMFYGTKDYDGFLSYEFGNYMELPPESERDPHSPVSSYSF